MKKLFHNSHTNIIGIKKVIILEKAKEEEILSKGIANMTTLAEVLLSLDFGIGVFHNLLRMNFGGNELLQGALQRRTLTLQQVA